ncbi:MAG: hypothetical protein Q9165_006741 [Trypethelium subeluteriae]
MPAFFVAFAFLISGVSPMHVQRAPTSTIEARNTVNNLPSGNKDCNGNNYAPSDIETAVSFGWTARRAGQTYHWDHPKGKKTAEYPHRFTPTQMNLQWSDFNLPGCATGPDDPKVSEFLEYPIITGGQAWQGGDTRAGNDRVIFQNIDASTAAFCGIVRHPGTDGVDNHFQLCNDPVGSQAVAPYAQGTCSLHLTQWDYDADLESRTPRYDVEVKILDNSKAQIGFQSRTGCDASTPVYVPSALEDDLSVIAESTHDYIAFSLPGQSWPSDGKFGPTDAHNPCSVGGWDGSDYPSVSSYF